ncbi:MAG: hypothetical protein ABIT83_25120, partial [Massilia sp.]
AFPRLPATLHTACLRLLWAAGFSAGIESLVHARVRARGAAQALAALAADGPVLLLGHGIMNRLIARELTTLGWMASERQGKGYWQTARIFSTDASCTVAMPQ